jgi:hypothetical protein
MAAKVRPPDYSKAKSYERYKIELKAWREITELPKSKQGIAIALSLPEENDIREQVFDCLSIDTLKDEKGFESLIEFLDKKLGKDDLSDSWEKFSDFEEFERKNQVSTKEYIDTFDLKYSKLNKMKLTLPSPILAFKLLKSSNISKTERMLVLTGMDYTHTDSLYEQAKKSLLKFKGSQNDESSGIKLEAALVAEENEEDEVYWTAGARGGRGRNWNGNRNGGNWNGDKRSRNGGNWNSRDRNWNGRNRNGEDYGNWRNRNGEDYRENWRNRNEEKWSGGTDKHTERHLNPIVDGKPLLCGSCGSYRHLKAVCPDSLEDVNVVQEKLNVESEIVLFTGYNEFNLEQLAVDAKNCAVLDTACSSTVCGDGWIKSYLSSLNEKDLEKVVIKEGKKIFKFGAGEKIKSKASYSLPVVLAGKPVTLVTDVVDSDIPLLLSKNAMKRAKVKLNLVDGTADIFGKQVSLNTTSLGHFCVPIGKENNDTIETVYAIDVCDENRFQSEKFDENVSEYEKSREESQFAKGKLDDDKLIENVSDYEECRVENQSVNEKFVHVSENEKFRGENQFENEKLDEENLTENVCEYEESRDENLFEDGDSKQDVKFDDETQFEIDDVEQDRKSSDEVQFENGWAENNGVQIPSITFMMSVFLSGILMLLHILILVSCVFAQVTSDTIDNLLRADKAGGKILSRSRYSKEKKRENKWEIISDVFHSHNCDSIINDGTDYVGANVHKQIITNRKAY